MATVVAANGLIMFGLSTAFLIEFVGDVREEEEERNIDMDQKGKSDPMIGG